MMASPAGKLIGIGSSGPNSLRAALMVGGGGEGFFATHWAT